jgi:hypothetical protein
VLRERIGKAVPRDGLRGEDDLEKVGREEAEREHNGKRP